MTYSSICQCVYHTAINQLGVSFDRTDSIEYTSSKPSKHMSTASMSSLEASVQEYATHAPSVIASSPTGKAYRTMDATPYALVPDYSTGMIIARQDHFEPGMLLRKDRPCAPFTGDASAVKEYVQDLFFHVTGHKMSYNVTIEIVSQDELRRAHEEFGGVWSDGIQGFCINRNGSGQSLIMIREGALDSVLVTIGHEIGHSRSIPLQSKLDEEAKAFAFQMEWAHAIVKNDVAGLAQSIDLAPRPAKNGLHDLACLFVEHERRKGLKASDIFTKLIRGDLHVAG